MTIVFVIVNRISYSSRARTAGYEYDKYVGRRKDVNFTISTTLSRSR